MAVLKRGRCVLILFAVLLKYFDLLRYPQELAKQQQLCGEPESGTGVFGMGMSAVAFVPLASIGLSHECMTPSRPLSSSQ
ncbi:hypothetical protein C8J57DRAFT_1297661 [Mycena rebaudengoi]|nr:hypothetical protein C8J57DRAFT_1297661 [Mycena rebaudengoi]